MRRVLPFALVVISACGGRTPLAQRGDGGVSMVCLSDPPACVAVGDDPCGAPKNVGAHCDEQAKTWSCPSGSITRAPNPTGVCRPFHDGTLTALEGSLSRVPTEDGRCLWIGERATKKGDIARSNVAFDVTDDALFGACPQKPLTLGEIFDLDEPQSTLYVPQILGGIRFAGKVRVIYRLFRIDPNAPFAVTEMGGGFAHWNAQGTRIVVPGVAGLRWGPDLSLGDASLVSGDHLVLWGCPPPIDVLTEKCVVARFDASEDMELFHGNGQWSKSTDQSTAARVFDSGPWLSSVVPSGSGFVHVHAVGFGSDLQTHTAASIDGPWTAGAALGKCDLASADKKSFCAGPVVHLEMADPTHPRGIVVTYGVGTTAPDGAALRQAHPDDYWPRLVWSTLP